jgi:RimJ/RimL family protein N-acetyltransferase
MSVPDPVIETPRLALREMTFDDLDFVASMLADPEVMRYYPRCLTLDESVVWIEGQRQRYRVSGYGFGLAVARATGEPVGQIGLTPPRVEGVPYDDIGYLIHRPFWRRGLASEGAAASRAYAFEVLDRPQVVCLIRPENGPSQGVALKIGMAREVGRVVELAGFDHWVYTASRQGP